jgi:hypothetical protein
LGMARISSNRTATAPAILAIGVFGRAVAARLRRSMPPSTDVIGATDLEAIDGRPVVLTSWRECRELALQLDNRPASWWLPVVYTHPTIRVGPIFGPQIAGCYECLAIREWSTGPHPDQAKALWDLYDNDPDAGPGGFLPHQVAVASGLAVAIMQSEPEPFRPLYSYEVLTNVVRAHGFVPRSACVRWRRGVTVRRAVGEAG